LLAMITPTTRIPAPISTYLSVFFFFAISVACYRLVFEIDFIAQVKIYHFASEHQVIFGLNMIKLSLIHRRLCGKKLNGIGQAYLITLADNFKGILGRFKSRRRGGIAFAGRPEIQYRLVNDLI